MASWGMKRPLGVAARPVRLPLDEGVVEPHPKALGPYRIGEFAHHIAIRPNIRVPDT